MKVVRGVLVILIMTEVYLIKDDPQDATAGILDGVFHSRQDGPRQAPLLNHHDRPICYAGENQRITYAQDGRRVDQNDIEKRSRPVDQLLHGFRVKAGSPTLAVRARRQKVEIVYPRGQNRLIQDGRPRKAVT